MKVSLIYPRLKYQTGDPPLGMALLAAVVRRAGHKVDLIDSTFHQDINYIKNRLKNFNPDFVAMYTDSMMFNDSTEIMKFSKEFIKAKVIVGGPHATLQPETLKDHADFIVKGEAEDTILEIIGGKHKNGIIEPNRPDLAKLPIPAYDLLEMNKYVKLWHLFDSLDPGLRGTNIFSSRGCPYKCTFCQPVIEKIFGKGVRTRKVDGVIEELIYLKEKFNIQAFFLQDDTFTANPKWAMEFGQKLIDNKLNLLWGCNSRADLLNENLMRTLHKSGLRVMHIGIESGSQRVLDEIYHKGIKLDKVPATIKLAEKIGIRCLCFFMLGAPGETKKEINQTIKFASSLDATEITATITTPLPNTYLYDMIKDRYKITDDFSNFDYYKNQSFENPEISFNELKFLQKKLLIRFYTHPKRWGYILKHFTSPTGIKKMWLKINRFM